MKAVPAIWYHIKIGIIQSNTFFTNKFFFFILSKGFRLKQKKYKVKKYCSMER